MYKIFIDGREGTTGLKIHSRLAERKDISLIVLPEESRKDPIARKEALNACDIAFLCLPDQAAKEAVSMIENPNVRVIDTSTAHRTSPEWTYGFPELSPAQENAIRTSSRVAVPGCHASGFISLIYPLIQKKAIQADTRLCCTSVTGYSGGGKKMIQQYEDAARNTLLNAPRQYGIAQEHKHLKEMKYVSGLTFFPAFSPIVADFYSGMCVTVPLFKEDLMPGFTIDSIREIYKKAYANGPIVLWRENIDEEGFLSANALSGHDSMEISVCGNQERILLVSHYDNLGKGASGAAIQCMNLMLGTDITIGLTL